MPNTNALMITHVSISITMLTVNNLLKSADTRFLTVEIEKAFFNVTKGNKSVNRAP